MERNARRHETAAEQGLSARLGTRGMDEFGVGDIVSTPDGIDGVIVEVFEGYQGNSYEVVLHDGAGGGEYRGNDLQRTARRSEPGSGIEGREIQARRYINPLVCDRCGKTADTSKAGGRGGHTALCPECAEKGSKTAARADLPLAPRGEVHTATDDYPELDDILWTNPDHIASVPVRINNVSLAKQAGQLEDVVNDPNQPWWWRKVVGPAVQRVNDNLDPAFRGSDLMTGPSPDWCRFRRESHCYFPKVFDEKGSAEAGYSVWFPEDRGLCQRWDHAAQKGCEVSEPGPNSGEKMWAPDATYAWANGGQRWDRKYSSKTAAWKDVNEKATRIRRDGGVRIISNTGPTVTAEVRGDHGIYVTTITRVPGGKGVGVWYCSCDWSKYAWDRTGDYKKYEGRKCAHATALLYEMQAGEMFGGEIHEVPEAPTWRVFEPKSDRRDDEILQEYGDQVYELTTAALTKEQKLLSLGNMQDAVIALTGTAQGDHLDRLDTFLASSTAARIRVSCDDGRRHGSFSGQVGGRILTDLRLTEEGVYAAGQILHPSQVLYPTYHPSAGLRVGSKASVDLVHLLGARSTEEHLSSIPDHLRVNLDDAWGSVRYVCREHMGSGRIMFASPEHPCEVCGATSEGGQSRTASMDEGLPDLLDAIESGNFTHAGLIIKAASSGRVLLTQRTPFHGDDEETYGKWEFPGGGLDDGEDPLDGAIREFEEETGLTLPESCSIDGHYTNDNYISIIITVPDEAWTVNADLLDLETMGIGWFDIETIEDVDGFVRPELLRVDYDIVREAIVGQDRVGAALADSPEAVTSILLDSPEPVMDAGVAYGSDGDPDDTVGYDGQDDMTSVAAFVPGDPRLAHLAGGESSGDDVDIAKAAAEFLSKSAVKTFTHAEQLLLIEEGARGHVGASNTDRLDIEGTFYESAEADEIGFW